LPAPGKRGSPRRAALERFTIITTDPNEVTEKIRYRWLDPSDPERPPTDLLQPVPAEKMRAWPVSDRVGTVRNDDPTLLTETQPAPVKLGLFD